MKFLDLSAPTAQARLQPSKWSAASWLPLNGYAIFACPSPCPRSRRADTTRANRSTFIPSTLRTYVRELTAMMAEIFLSLARAGTESDNWEAFTRKSSSIALGTNALATCRN